MICGPRMMWGCDHATRTQTVLQMQISLRIHLQTIVVSSIYESVQFVLCYLERLLEFSQQYADSMFTHTFFLFISMICYSSPLFATQNPSPPFKHMNKLRTPSLNKIYENHSVFYVNLRNQYTYTVISVRHVLPSQTSPTPASLCLPSDSIKNIRS